MLPISNDQLSAIRTAVRGRPDGVHQPLDPSNPDDAAAIRAFLELSGKTAEACPGLHADLDRLTRSASPLARADGQVLDIVDSGRDVHGRATARVWHLDTEGGLMASSLALAVDADSGRPVALGYANRVGGGLVPAATRSESALPAPDRMTTIGFACSLSTPDTDPKFGVVARTAPVIGAGPIAAVVTDPVTHNSHSEVRIGLGRPWDTKDLDYWYKQDLSDQPQLVVPFTGSAHVPYPLANVDGGRFTEGLQVSTWLYSRTARSFVAHLDSRQPLGERLTGDASTSVVTWSYPYDGDGTPGNYASLMYEPLAEANDNLTAFVFSFQIPVRDPSGVTPTYNFTVCTKDGRTARRSTA
ncbi:hypothetical protein [Streptomyces sp. B6B3]|uniref:hypothetical protein n=1 Tax=Streptomyces sp. B6B3 TaxID=3153570 RepID=UPI00325E8680